jgi:DNA-binding NarL/FixJ family response regulator
LSRQKTIILHLLGQGLTRKMIAGDLRISPDTVKGHIRGICEHFGVSGCHPATAITVARSEGALPQVKPPNLGS